MIKKIISSFFLVAVFTLIFVSSVFAEVVNFRPETRACYGVSLNETLSVKVNGQTGAGCDFSVDVTAGGEWVATGEYFDSPPYAWGKDAFYSDNNIENFSFTCQNPTYSLNNVTLPSYVTVTSEENVPATSSKPAGKRYKFSVGEGAPEGQSFNAGFEFSTNCQMKRKDDQGQVVNVQSVSSGSSRCMEKSPININPRGKSVTYPIKIGTSCGPTATPTSPPACNSACDSKNPNSCAGAKDSCTYCDPGTNTCQPKPTATITPTATPTPPACNSACDAKDPTSCSGAKDGCTECNPTTNTCQKPPACNVACDAKDPNACGGAKDGCTLCNPTTNTCQKPPACNVACDAKDPTSCSGAKDGCTECNPTTNTCQKPPACNVACDAKDPNACGGAKDSCTFCDPGSNTCKTPPACNVACSDSTFCQSATDSCTSCEAGKCQTPFSTDWCKCDSIEVSNLVSGQQASVTSYAKVESAEQVARAQIVSQKFTLYEGTNTTGTIIATGNVPATVESTTPTLVRYKSVWTFTVPQLKKGATYRIGVVANDAGTCQPKTTAANYSPRIAQNTQRSVLAETTEAPGFCSWPLVGFFARAAGFCDTPRVAQKAAPTPTITPVIVTTDEDSLQLNTFTPIQIVEKKCNYVIFKVL